MKSIFADMLSKPAVTYFILPCGRFIKLHTMMPYHWNQFPHFFDILYKNTDRLGLDLTKHEDDRTKVIIHLFV